MSNEGYRAEESSAKAPCDAALDLPQMIASVTAVVIVVVIGMLALGWTAWLPWFLFYPPWVVLPAAVLAILYAYIPERLVTKVHFQQGTQGR